MKIKLDSFYQAVTTWATEIICQIPGEAKFFFSAYTTQSNLVPTQAMRTEKNS